MFQPSQSSYAKISSLSVSLDVLPKRIKSGATWFDSHNSRGYSKASIRGAAKPLKSTKKFVLRSPSHSKVVECKFDSYYFPKPCVAWHCFDIEAMCATGYRLSI